MNPKLAQYQAEAEQARQTAQKANSFGGLLSGTLRGLPQATGKVASTVNSFTAKPALNATVVRPAVRLSQAVGTPIAKALGASPEGIARAQNTPVSVNTGLLGKIEVEPATSQKQVAGEGLEAASYLYSPGKAVEAISPLLKPTGKTLIQKGINLAENALGGYAADVGFGLQDQNKSVKEALKPGLGTALGTAIPLASEGAQAVKASAELYKSMTPAERQAGKIGGSEFPKRGIGKYPTIHEGGVIKMVEGEPVKLVDGVETFLHEGDGGWVVSEASTGRFISESTSKEGAIAKASFSIKNVGRDKFLEMLKQNKLPTNNKEGGYIGNPFKKGNLPEGKPEGEGKIDQPSEKPKEPLLPQTPQGPSELQRASSLLSDTKVLANSQVNVEHLNISPEGRDLVNKTVEEVKPTIENFVGTRLSNKEAINLADNSASIMKRAVNREATLNWESAMLKARQKLAQSAESGTVDKDFLESLLAVKTHGTDVARKLQSLSIGADPKNITAKQAIVEAVMKVTSKTDEILKAAEGVNFNDLKQATDFYRQFVKPKMGEWIDLLRYNSMLSSPKTHIVNIVSNLVNTIMVAPIEKTVTGGLDFMASPFKSGRDAFAGEGGAYLKNYFTGISDATQRFSDVMRGQRPYTNLDTKNIPIASSGFKGRVVSTLSYPMRLLEGMDQFFTALGEGGERGALNYRARKGGRVGILEATVQEKTAYRLFRQDLKSPEQGHVLDAIDQLTILIQKARNSKNPIVSTVAKFTVPFLKTPMNIFKQGVEYSPAGLTTLIGAKNKTEQLSKAIIGSSVFMGAATLLTSNRLTWGEPIGEKEKNAFRAAGKQSYSVKVGDHWVSYQKLPPALSFPLAMVAVIDDTRKNRKLSDDTADLILTGIAKYGSFLADQSYAKSIGDLLAAVKGGESGISKVISNYPQQLVPFKGLVGWVNRFFDDVQRKVNPDASFIDKQMQQLMMSIPGLSDNVPARLDTKGQPIKYSNNTFNAVSPFNVTTENPEGAKAYQNLEDIKQLNRNDAERSKILRTKIQSVYDQVKRLMQEGKKDKAQSVVDKLSTEEYDKYKAIRTTERGSHTEQLRGLLKVSPQDAVSYLRSQDPDEQQRLLKVMTDAEYVIYRRAKNSIINQ